MAKAQLAMLQQPDQRVPERHIVNIMAQLRGLGAWFAEVELLDLSTDGFRAEIETELAPGACGWLKLTGLPPANCQVVWSAGGEAGFKFTSPLHPANVEIAGSADRKRIRKGHFGPSNRNSRP